MSASSIASASSTIFDHEKLDVYQRGLEFITWVTQHFGELREAKVPQIKSMSVGRPLMPRRVRRLSLRDFEDVHEHEDEHEDEIGAP